MHFLVPLAFKPYLTLNLAQNKLTDVAIGALSVSIVSGKLLFGLSINLKDTNISNGAINSLLSALSEKKHPMDFKIIGIRALEDALKKIQSEQVINLVRIHRHLTQNRIQNNVNVKGLPSSLATKVFGYYAPQGEVIGDNVSRFFI